MNVFVTGATGFVGEEILRHLRDAGHTSRILARHPQSARARQAASNYRAEIHPGNILDGETLMDGLQGVDAVIHLVGIISELGQSTFENVHTHGTQNIVSAAQKAGVKRFVQMSALGVRPNAASRYHRSKWEAEEIVRQSRLDFTIFRPSIIYGPEDHFVNLFARWTRYLPALPVMGNGQSKLQPVPLVDVATCFVEALNERTSIRQTFDLCGKDILSFDEMLDAILQVTAKKRGKIHLPLGLARCQAALMEFVFAKLLGRPSPLNRDQLIMLTEDNVGNPEPANRLFGLKPIGFKSGISSYLER